MMGHRLLVNRALTMMLLLGLSVDGLLFNKPKPPPRTPRPPTTHPTPVPPSSSQHTPPSCEQPSIANPTPNVTFYTCNINDQPDTVVVPWTDESCGCTLTGLKPTNENGGKPNPCARTFLRFWQATDSCNNEVSAKQFITVRLSPTYVPPPDITVDCSVTNPKDHLAGKPTAVGCADASPTITYKDTGDGKIGINRTWTIIDTCRSRQQVVSQTISCCWPPKFSSNAASFAHLTFEQCDLQTIPEVDEPRIENADRPCCNGTVDMAYEDTDLASNECSREVQRTWTLRDSCNATTNVTQRISLVRPKNTYELPPSIRTNCANLDQAVAGQVTRNGCIPYNATYEDKINGHRAIQRTWTIRGACSPPIAHVQVISCCSPPSFLGKEEPHEISLTRCDLDFRPNVTNPTFQTDESCCRGNGSIDFNETVLAATDCSRRIEQRWTVTDACGRSINRTRTISIYIPANQYEPPPAAEKLNCESPEVINPNATGSPSIIGCDSNTNVSFSDDYPRNAAFIDRVWTIQETCSNRTVVLHQKLNCCTPPAIELAHPTVTFHRCNVNSTDIGPPPVLTDMKCCDGEGELSSNDTVLQSTDARREFERAWTLVDACGRSVSAVQVIVIEKKSDCDSTTSSTPTSTSTPSTSTSTSSASTASTSSTVAPSTATPTAATMASTVEITNATALSDAVPISTFTTPASMPSTELSPSSKSHTRRASKRTTRTPETVTSGTVTVGNLPPTGDDKDCPEESSESSEEECACHKCCRKCCEDHDHRKSHKMKRARRKRSAE